LLGLFRAAADFAVSKMGNLIKKWLFPKWKQPLYIMGDFVIQLQMRLIFVVGGGIDHMYL